MFFAIQVTQFILFHPSGTNQALKSLEKRDLLTPSAPRRPNKKVSRRSVELERLKTRRSHSFHDQHMGLHYGSTRNASSRHAKVKARVKDQTDIGQGSPHHKEHTHSHRRIPIQVPNSSTQPAPSFHPRQLQPHKPTPRDYNDPIPTSRMFSRTVPVPDRAFSRVAYLDDSILPLIEAMEQFETFDGGLRTPTPLPSSFSAYTSRVSASAGSSESTTISTGRKHGYDDTGSCADVSPGENIILTTPQRPVPPNTPRSVNDNMYWTPSLRYSAAVRVSRHEQGGVADKT